MACFSCWHEPGRRCAHHHRSWQEGGGLGGESIFSTRFPLNRTPGLSLQMEGLCSRAQSRGRDTSEGQGDTELWQGAGGRWHGAGAGGVTEAVQPVQRMAVAQGGCWVWGGT